MVLEPKRTLASLEGVLVPASALEGVPLFEGLSADELVTVATAMRFGTSPRAQSSVAKVSRARACWWWSRGWHTPSWRCRREPELRSRSVFAEGRLTESCGRAM